MFTNKTEVPIRFSEVDSLRVVWHGHYIKFFEDGREAFGREHGLTYLDVYLQALFCAHQLTEYQNAEPQNPHPLAPYRAANQFQADHQSR